MSSDNEIIEDCEEMVEPNKNKTFKVLRKGPNYSRPLVYEFDGIELYSLQSNIDSKHIKDFVDQFRNPKLEYDESHDIRDNTYYNTVNIYRRSSDNSLVMADKYGCIISYKQTETIHLVRLYDDIEWMEIYQLMMNRGVSVKDLDDLILAIAVPIRLE